MFFGIIKILSQNNVRSNKYIGSKNFVRKKFKIQKYYDSKKFGLKEI